MANKNSLPKGAKIYNAIIAKDTKLESLPKATKTNIGEISNILFNDGYQPELNQFINNLVNRIALTIVRNKSYDNPLKIFKKGSIPLGTDIQEIFTNPANAEPYEISNEAMAKLLTITDPDTKVAYYRRNRQDLYTKTITREALQAAFKSWDDFDEYVASITNSLYSGNYIDEFEYTKALVNGAYANNKVITQNVTKPVDEKTSNAFLKQVKNLYDFMTFPSSNYNAYSKMSEDPKPVITWTDEDRICLIVRADVMNNVDVDSLARAFNIDRANFAGRVYKVDKFENDELLGVICDEAWLQIYDNIFRFDEFYNARTMAWNEYLHVWGTFAISPFANAIALVTKESTEVTSITINASPIALEMTSPEGKSLDITVEPEGATTTINYSVDKPDVVEVTKNTNTNITLKPLKVGTATLTAKASNNVTNTQQVNVTEGA